MIAQMVVTNNTIIPSLTAVSKISLFFKEKFHTLQILEIGPESWVPSKNRLIDVASH